MRLLTYNLIEVEDNGRVHSTTDTIPLSKYNDTIVTFEYLTAEHELSVKVECR